MITIIEPGYAVTKEYITSLRCQDGSPYLLGYINYGSEQKLACAVKINNLDNEETNISAYREKEVLMKVSHQNIAQTYKIIEKDNKMYIFKEYDEHITLKTILQRVKNSSIDEKDVLNLATQLINCLDYMESLSLTNRDLNPANILFNKQQVYKIFDFGSAKVIDENQIYLSMAVGFNECFMSPQMLQIDDSQEIDYYKSDIWSLGMILYYFGENQYPWAKENQIPKDLDDEIEKMKDRPLVFNKIKSTPLRNLIKKMLTYNQDQRPSAKQLLEDSLIKSQLPQQNPQQIKLELLSILYQNLNEMKRKYELDEIYEDLIFNHLIRFFTENKSLINQGSQIYQSYHQLLDYQMFNRKELWQDFKIQYNTKKFLKNFVNEFKRQSMLNVRQQQELLLLIKTIDCQKQFPDNPQELIEIIENQYVKD